MEINIEHYKFQRVVVKEQKIIIPEKPVILKNSNEGFIALFPEISSIVEDGEYKGDGKVKRLNVIELTTFIGEEGIKAYTIPIYKEGLEDFRDEKSMNKQMVFQYLKEPDGFTTYKLETFHEKVENVIEILNEKSQCSLVG